MRDDVAPKYGWFSVIDTKCVTKHAEGLQLEKGKLTLVVDLVIEKAITANTVSRNAFNGFYFDHAMITRQLPLMAEVVMTS